MPKPFQKLYSFLFFFVLPIKIPAVIVLGKCMEFYSQFYPNVTDNRKQVSILESIKRMREIVEQLTHDQAEVGFSEVPTEQRLI